MEPSFELLLLIEAHVAPSEEPGSVRKAIENVLGKCAYSIHKQGDVIRASSSDPRCLVRVHDQLRDRHVRGAARRLLLVNRDGDKTRVMVNRQAAFHGVIALCSSEEESTLGPINMIIRSHELDSVIEWLTAYSSG